MGPMPLARSRYSAVAVYGLFLSYDLPIGNGDKKPRTLGTVYPRNTVASYTWCASRTFSLSKAFPTMRLLSYSIKWVGQRQDTYHSCIV